ncbi:hypothetical protein Tco_0572652 [Tanacetum coccineum]
MVVWGDVKCGRRVKRGVQAVKPRRVKLKCYKNRRKDLEQVREKDKEHFEEAIEQKRKLSEEKFETFKEKMKKETNERLAKALTQLKEQPPTFSIPHKHLLIKTACWALTKSWLDVQVDVELSGRIDEYRNSDGTNERNPGKGDSNSQSHLVPQSWPLEVNVYLFLERIVAQLRLHFRCLVTENDRLAPINLQMVVFLPQLGWCELAQFQAIVTMEIMRIDGLGMATPLGCGLEWCFFFRRNLEIKTAGLFVANVMTGLQAFQSHGYDSFFRQLVSVATEDESFFDNPSERKRQAGFGWQPGRGSETSGYELIEFEIKDLAYGQFLKANGEEHITTKRSSSMDEVLR